jgi:sugar phosphate isomerase/epimerase
MTNAAKYPIGVFTSIDAGFGVHLEVADELKIPTIQLHAPQQSTRTQAVADEFLQRINRLGIQLTCVFGGFDDESYEDIPTVERTVGLVPKATRSARLAEMKEIADFTKMLHCNVVGMHLGFVPHDPTSEDYRDVVAVTQELCQYVAQNGQAIHLETGQETADALLQFIEDCGQPNLFINFDPANMVLYGTGDPIEALEKVGKYVKSVHCKDALTSEQPGKTWGQEVALGTGDVNMQRYLETLVKIGYEGPLTIEREIPQDRDRQKNEIQIATELLCQIRETL